VPQFLVLLCASWVQLNQDRGAFCLLSGNSSHVLPSRSLPAAFLFVPPHRFTTKARRHQESPGFFPFVSWSLGGCHRQSENALEVASPKTTGATGAPAIFSRAATRPFWSRLIRTLPNILGFLLTN
jgi:hypothetical protein